LVAFREGRIRVQDQGSQLAALALVEAKQIGKNEQWLDLCAGPGGKAALLAAEARVNGATLTCNEVAPHRAKLVRQAIAVVDDKIRVTVEDGRTYANNHSEKFDRILLDAPCTGLGALRRRPESRWRKAQSDVAELSALQEQLLQSAWDCLKPGGVIAYVTCSPHLAETNAIIDWAKRKLSGLELLDTNEVLSGINANLHLNRTRKTAQLWPHIHQTDAMFIALLSKTAN
jgi:16S rRNA (cytosine967-C5)-methyltransferase